MKEVWFLSCKGRDTRRNYFHGSSCRKVLAERFALSHDETRYAQLCLHTRYNDNSCHACYNMTHTDEANDIVSVKICIASMCILLNLLQQRQMRTDSRYSFSRYRSLKDTINNIPSRTHTILSTSIFWSRYNIH